MWAKSWQTPLPRLERVVDRRIHARGRRAVLEAREDFRCQAGAASRADRRRARGRLHARNRRAAASAAQTGWRSSRSQNSPDAVSASSRSHAARREAIGQVAAAAAQSTSASAVTRQARVTARECRSDARRCRGGPGTSSRAKRAACFRPKWRHRCARRCAAASAPPSRSR